MSLRAHVLALGLLALACAPRPATAPSSSTTATSDSALPEHLRPTVEAWFEVARRNIRAVFDDQHQTAEWAEFDAARAAAREQIANADADDYPWLLGRYLDVFHIIGVGTKWADAVLEIPPSHPVWSSDSAGLVKALPEASGPIEFRAYLDAVAAAHANPNVQASVLALELADADRGGDWARAERLYAQLQSLELADTLAAYDAKIYDPARELRVDKHVPKFCAPAIAGPHTGFSVCIDELFPHDTRTLLIGWATWCGPCNAQLPRVVELSRGRGLRVITIDYADDNQRAIEHLRELGVDDWTVLDLSAKQMKRDAADGNVEGHAIPYLALVDEQGIIEAGPPWLDADALADLL